MSESAIFWTTYLPPLFVLLVVGFLGDRWAKAERIRVREARERRWRMEEEAREEDRLERERSRRMQQDPVELSKRIRRDRERAARKEQRAKTLLA